MATSAIFPIVVNLREADQHRLGELAQGVHEAVILAFVGECLDEFLLHFCIFRANRADGDGASVRLIPLLNQVCRIGVNRHVRVTVALGGRVVDDNPRISGDGAVFVDDPAG